MMLFRYFDVRWTVVRIDNDTAVVWVPYKFFIDNKVDHCGTDLLSLITYANADLTDTMKVFEQYGIRFLTLIFCTLESAI